MRLTVLFLALCSAICLESSRSLAQKLGGEACDVPVVVADFYNKVVPDLQKADFAVRLGGVPVPVSGAMVGGGPKRIALIIDASESVPNDEWKLEIKAVKNLTQHARPDDRFDLSVIGADSTEHSFLSSEELALRVKKLERSKAPERTLDALMNALHILDDTQFGDTIFLVGHDEDSGGTTTFDEVRERMLKTNVRFYGLSFADKLAKLPPGFDLNKPLPTGFGPSKLDSLSAETGYFFSFHSVRSLQLAGQEELFKGFLADLYAWIAQPYRLSLSDINSKGREPMEVDVAQMDARRIHKNGIHYPHLITCASAANP